MQQNVFAHPVHTWHMTTNKCVNCTLLSCFMFICIISVHSMHKSSSSVHHVCNFTNYELFPGQLVVGLQTSCRIRVTSPPPLAAPAASGGGAQSTTDCCASPLKALAAAIAPLPQLLRHLRRGRRAPAGRAAVRRKLN